MFADLKRKAKIKRVTSTYQKTDLQSRFTGLSVNFMCCIYRKRDCYDHLSDKTETCEDLHPPQYHFLLVFT